MVDLKKLKTMRVMVPVRGDILAATEAKMAQVQTFLDKLSFQNASVVIEVRLKPGTVMGEAANDMRLKIEGGVAFAALCDALKAARPGDGDNSTSGQPRAKDVVLVLVEDKEESPETWDEIGVPQVPPAVPATGCGGKDPMPPPS